MRRIQAPLILVAVLLVAAWAAWPRYQVARTATPTAGGLAMPARDFSWQGSISCASAACHNAGGPRGSRGSEYNTWITYDPHARAGSVLYGERSKQIEKNFRGLETLQDARPERDSLCLDCHVSPHVDRLSHRTRLSLEELVQEGVSCESCHGPAERWRTEHYRAGWRQLRDRQRQDNWGMTATKDLAVRADRCVACHVGAPGREVNHDLLAAGHPRLNFEFGAYQATLPKHWSEREDKARYPDLEARAWSLGQVVSARAALELLVGRATPPEAGKEDGQRPWPEFAEYDCFACHHDLQGQSWRQARDLSRTGAGAPKKPPSGILPWGTWYYAMLPELPGASPKVLADLQNIKGAMQKPHPNRKAVAKQAADAAGELGSWAQQLVRRTYTDEAILDDQFAAIARDGGPLAHGSWDEAAQLYLGLAALYHAKGDLHPRQRDSRLRAYLVTMGQMLAFPLPGGVKYDSPEEKGYGDRERQFHDALQQIRHRLGQ
jgi:hypothetical protein